MIYIATHHQLISAKNIIWYMKLMRYVNMRYANMNINILYI